MKNNLQYKIESFAVEENSLLIFGWACSSGGPVKIRVMSKNTPCSVRADRIVRSDINSGFPGIDENYESGFRLRIGYGEESLISLFPLTIIFSGAGVGTRYETVSYRKVNSLLLNRDQEFVRIFKKTLITFRDEGISGVVTKTRRRLGLGKRYSNTDYRTWIANTEPGDKELKAQSRSKLKASPLVSVCVPVYRTDKKLLEAMINSVKDQTYDRWELCIADGSENGFLNAILSRLSEGDSRIRFRTLDKNLGISGNTNMALEMARGELIAFLDHDDTLSPDALFEVVRAWNYDNTREVIYSDQDMLSLDGAVRYEPSFKPDFNLYFLRSVNYICHLFVITAELYQKVGSLNGEFDGAQDYDYIFRCVENARNVWHIPKVLYHWRAAPGSVAQNQDSKQYAFDAGARAIEAHYRRLGIEATVEETKIRGNYRTRFALSQEPCVSVIIPNKDHVPDLERCLKSLVSKSTYRNYEIIIVENNSTSKETAEYYRHLKSKGITGLRILRYRGGFNFSSINNFAVSKARGKYILFLNNDTELIDGGLIRELLSVCEQDGVGAVGARLFYDNNTIQHAGVILGIGGIAGHAFLGFGQNDPGYQNRAVSMQELSAVTAACMMTKREAFERVGGFDENLEVAFNDVDLCLKIIEAGYKIIYDPYATLYHYESRSRGYETSKKKLDRFGREIDYFNRKWKWKLNKTDPYYNPNLTLKTSDFAIRSVKQ